MKNTGETGRFTYFILLSLLLMFSVNKIRKHIDESEKRILDKIETLKQN